MHCDDPSSADPVTHFAFNNNNNKDTPSEGRAWSLGWPTRCDDPSSADPVTHFAFMMASVAISLVVVASYISQPSRVATLVADVTTASALPTGQQTGCKDDQKWVIRVWS